MVLQGIEHGALSGPAQGDIYGRMLCLPLFMGMGRDELQLLLAKAKMVFGKHAQGEKIVRNGQHCGCLLIVTHGVVEIGRQAAGGAYSVAETLHGPVIIQPECVFGRFQSYTLNAKVISPQANTIRIDKADILGLAARSLVFRLNIISFLATATQKGDYALWQQAPATLERRIAIFLAQRCATPSGQKVFNIKMQALAEILNSKRAYVSAALNHLQDKGLVSLSRCKIVIPAMQELISSGL